jgi:hypothetical protein
MVQEVITACGKAEFNNNANKIEIYSDRWTLNKIKLSNTGMF